MKKWTFALMAGLLAASPAQTAMAEPVADAIARSVCSGPEQSLKLSDEQKQAYLGNMEYEAMFSDFGADTGKVMQFKKAASHQASSCKRVEYGMDGNKVWQKTAVYVAPVELKDDTVHAPNWAKLE